MLHMFDSSTSPTQPKEKPKLFFSLFFNKIIKQK